MGGKSPKNLQENLKNETEVFKNWGEFSKKFLEKLRDKLQEIFFLSIVHAIEKQNQLGHDIVVPSHFFRELKAMTSSFQD